ncbi:hypothetical protein [Arthrobacter rhombi]|uniref:hypothetical protein n=1 Tax=Arthrobacter rhombi TaxID=71253 RepID=UPI003FD0891F
MDEEDITNAAAILAPILLPLAFAALGQWIKGRSSVRKSPRKDAHFVDDIELIMKLDGMAKEEPMAALSSVVVSLRVRGEMIVRLAPSQWVTNTLLFVQGSLVIVLGWIYNIFGITPEPVTWFLFVVGIAANLLWVCLVAGLGQHRRRLGAIVDAEDVAATEAAGSKKVAWLERLSTGSGGAEVTQRLVKQFISLRENGESKKLSTGQE